LDVSEKARIVAESAEPNANISDVARRNGVSRGLLTVWRRQIREALKTLANASLFATVAHRMSITMEAAFCVEALEEALAKHGRREIYVHICRAIGLDSASRRPRHPFPTASATGPGGKISKAL